MPLQNVDRLYANSVLESGGLPGYVSRITAMPEYGLGLTILVGCDTDCSTLLSSVQEIVSINLVRAAEKQIWKDIEQTYTGYYSATNSGLNSSLSLNSSSKSGLVVTSFISNGTDVLNQVIPGSWLDGSREWRLQLVPTSLFKNESSKKGEIWRGVPAYERDP